jgi:hypothetical protein
LQKWRAKLEDLNKKLLNATKLTASIIGAVSGFMSMEHGLFEILQGNIRPDNLVIEAIGPAQRFWELGRERAFTIIPSFLVTGILAMLVGLIVIIWSVAFIDKKYGVWILILLAIMMFLVGGGFAPPIYAILAIIAAFKINKPLPWWRKHLPPKLKDFLAALWPWVTGVFLALSLFLVESAIFGYPLILILTPENLHIFNSIVGWITFFGLGPLVLITAFAHNVRRHAE